ncbi:MAG: hypothetical protein U0984_13460 [Prosthecobacter sp.]|nr:hypothetical protein [Prosthecobacter sp.]
MASQASGDIIGAVLATKKAMNLGRWLYLLGCVLPNKKQVKATRSGIGPSNTPYRL